MRMKYLLARATDEEIQRRGECGGAVTAIFKYMLDKGVVDAVLTLERGDDVYDGVPVLLEDSSGIASTCGSLHCAPTMFGDLISRYLSDMRLAVAVKPCDAMAIRELEKRHQIDPDKVYKIGLNCGGTLAPVSAREMIETFYEMDPDDVVSEEIDRGKFIVELRDGSHREISIDYLEEEGFGRRENCQRCEIMVPRNADLACGNWGADDGWTFIEVNTERGQEIIEGARSSGYIEAREPSEKMVKIREKIENAMISMARKFQDKYLDEEYPSLDEWDEYWKRCINCFACRDACPVCFCRECELEKDYLLESDEKAPDPLTFQGVRLSHMGFSCINCGQCEDVCPMDIPIARIYHRIQKKYRDRTGFTAGVSQELPPMYSGEKD
ncbi:MULTISPECIES: Coenzyme F420 hydrogenase/dehydrogenase, beta subunit C-terminal domain [Methanothermobacter]|uniref:Coenzyme F420 hydrogenase/dehydrogenase, beta subunit C-terminal domain n=1 Tax=Methanothermobacter TaxID=145260 RepID=UPI00191BE545|nr:MULTISPECIES: Coenzyme F420 hydrogenase/dehydrogenase, beta subunit C-terminal domain [unclassified Methanothermobacter]